MSTDLVQVGSPLPIDPTARHLYLAASGDAPSVALRMLADDLYQGVMTESDYIIVEMSVLRDIGIGTAWNKLNDCNVWPFFTPKDADIARKGFQSWFDAGKPGDPPYQPWQLSNFLRSWRYEVHGERWCVVRARDVEVNYPSWRKAKAAIVESTPTVTTVTIIDAATTIDGKVDGVLSAECLRIYELAMREQSGYAICRFDETAGQQPMNERPRGVMRTLPEGGTMIALNHKQYLHAVYLWGEGVKRRKRWQAYKDARRAISVVVDSEVEPWE